MSNPKPFRRRYENARDFLEEAKQRIGDYESIMGTTEQEFNKLRPTGIKCRAFINKEDGEPEIIEVTRQTWNHLFRHPVKRRTKIEKLERALCWRYAIKLIERTTTYQGLSRETDAGGNKYDSFEIIGCVRGCRIKVVIKKQKKNTNAKKMLLSFWQLSSAPIKKGEPPPEGIVDVADL